MDIHTPVAVSEDEDVTDTSNYDNNLGNLHENSRVRLEAEIKDYTNDDVSDTSDGDVFNAVVSSTKTSSKLARRGAFRNRDRTCVEGLKLKIRRPLSVGGVITDNVNNLEALLPPEGQPILPRHVHPNRVQDIRHVLGVLHEDSQYAQQHTSPPLPRRSSRFRKPLGALM